MTLAVKVALNPNTTNQPTFVLKSQVQQIRQSNKILKKKKLWIINISRISDRCLVPVSVANAPVAKFTVTGFSCTVKKRG